MAGINPNDVKWDSAPTINPNDVKWDSPSAPSSQRTWEERVRDFGGTALRNTALAGRAVTDGLASLPLMIADMPVAAANLIHGKDEGGAYPYRLPSERWKDNQDAAFPKPQGAGEHIGQFLTSTLAGAAVPIGPKSDVPDSFVSPADTQKQANNALLQKAQDSGYVVPPSTSNPGGLNAALETVAGKRAMEQTAATRNQEVTNRIAKAAVGLSEDAPLTPEALSAVRKEAGASYEAIRNAGQITPDNTFRDTLKAIQEKMTGVEKDFPGTKASPLSAEIENLLGSAKSGPMDALTLTSAVPSVDAGNAITKIKNLRDAADVAGRQGDKGLASGYKQLADALESQIDRSLQAKVAAGVPGIDADAVKNFQNARATIAKTYTLEKALNPGNNNVSAQKLAAALRKGEPLTDDLRTAAQFGASFPRAAQEPLSSMGVNHLDTYAPLMSLLFGHSVPEKALGFAVPAARYGAKSYLLSGAGQAGAMAKTAQPANVQALAALLSAVQNSR